MKVGKFFSKYYLTNKRERVILIKPLSYMNLSGIVVKKYMDYFKISKDDILVIQDDLDMPVGKIKLKEKSSSGGHNGIKDIENTDREKYRFGLGKNSPRGRGQPV